MSIRVRSRFAVAAGVALGLAACGQGDADNVMAPDVNTLTPAQIDAALGPETGNAAVPANQQAEVRPAAEDTPATARPAPVPREAEPPEPEPAEEPAEETPPDGNATEI